VGPCPTFLALEKHCRLGPEFVDDLSAGAAGGAGHTLVVDDGYGANHHLRARFRHRGEDGGTFGAVRHAVGGILDIAAEKCFTFVR